MTKELHACKSKQRRVRIVEIFRDELGTAAHSRTTAAELANRLGADVRTIYRDIAELQAYGLPIKGEASYGYVWKGNSL